MAEFYMRDLCEKKGLSDKICVCSAATSDEEIGNPVYPPAARVLARHGISPGGKYARQVTKEDLSADYIIVMDEANRRNTERFALSFGREFYEKTKKRIHLLKEFSGGGNVADPWYTGDFDKAWKDICEGCDALLRFITGAKDVEI